MVRIGISCDFGFVWVDVNIASCGFSHLVVVADGLTAVGSGLLGSFVFFLRIWFGFAV